MSKHGADSRIVLLSLVLFGGCEDCDRDDEETPATVQGSGCPMGTRWTAGRCVDTDTSDQGDTLSFCGNAVVETGEVCDDGRTDACGSCNATCSGAGLGAACGDGVVCGELEACDHGNDPTSTCNGTCSGAAACSTAPALLRIPLRAFALADDDGGNAAVVTGPEIVTWVQKANEIFAQSCAGIELVFEAAGDLETRRDSRLNALERGGQGFDRANGLAASYPGKIVVLFRGGKSDGFAMPPSSGVVANFVAMPSSLSSSWIRVGKGGDPGWQADGSYVDEVGYHWAPNVWQLAHELGHYFDLGHTYPGWDDAETSNIEKATRQVAEHSTARGRPEALDGDGLTDTPPEAGASLYVAAGWDVCGPQASYTLSGQSASGGFAVSFSPQRNNLMSGFACEPVELTPQQVERMRASLTLPERRSLQD